MKNRAKLLRLFTKFERFKSPTLRATMYTQVTCLPIELIGWDCSFMGVLVVNVTIIMDTNSS